MLHEPHQRHDDPLHRPPDAGPPGASRAANVLVAATAVPLLIALAVVVALA